MRKVSEVLTMALPLYLGDGRDSEYMCNAVDGLVRRGKVTDAEANAARDAIRERICGLSTLWAYLFFRGHLNRGDRRYYLTEGRQFYLMFIADLKQEGL